MCALEAVRAQQALIRLKRMRRLSKLRHEETRDGRTTTVYPSMKGVNDTDFEGGNVAMML